MSRVVVLASISLMGWACVGGTPTAPSAGVPTGRPLSFGDPGVSALTNQPPALKLKTTPRASPGDPHSIIAGRAPLTVKFNLCESSDPDQVILPDGTQDPSGDVITWQFHFGDDGTEAFNPDGTFNPDAEHACRAEHTYSDPGTFVATVTVTDKHLEDQSREVGLAARETLRVTIAADAAFDGPSFEGNINGPFNFVGGSETSFGRAGGTASGFTEDGTFVLFGGAKSPPVAVCPDPLGFPIGGITRTGKFGTNGVGTDSNGLRFYFASEGSTIGGADASRCRLYFD